MITKEKLFPLSWAHVYNTNHKPYNTIDIANKSAREAGYPYFSYCGRIYDTRTGMDTCYLSEQLGQ